MDSMTSNQFGISVVVCTYNGKERLQPTLNSILNQKISSALFELIVVDNASQDNTRDFCEKLLSDLGAAASWKIVSEQKPGLNNARLRGLVEAKFDVVLFCDDDNTLAPDYLKVAFDLLESNPAIGALGGCGIPSFVGAKPGWFDRYSNSFAVGPQASVEGKLAEKPAELYGAGTFFRKTPLLNFFDKGFTTIMSDRKGKSLASGGDVEWCYIVQLAGYEIWYSHRLTFMHVMPEDRMQWSYCLRLKKGIASGAGKLFPYKELIRNQAATWNSFVSRWILRTIKLNFAFLKFKIQLLFRADPLNADIELANVVWQARITSWWLNGFNAFRNFILLKKFSTSNRFSNTTEF